VKNELCYVNPLTSGCFQGFSEKKTPKRMWLCVRRNFSAPVRVMDLVETSKDAASLLV